MPEPRIPLRWAMDVSDLTRFELVTAAMLGWIDYYAYYDDADKWYLNLLPASSVNRIPADPATGRPQGWILRFPECNVVAFAGTTEFNQLYRYCMAATFSKLRPTGPTEFVGSIWALWARNVYADFHTLLHETIDNNKTIFTGHSAGGALAASLLRYIDLDGVAQAFPTTSYTFGCPRIGDKAFQAATAGYFNLIIPTDPVPKLPFAGMVTRPVPSFPIPTYGAGPFHTFNRHGKVYFVTDDGFVTPASASLDLQNADGSLAWDAYKAYNSRFGAQRFGNVQRPDATLADFNRYLDTHLMRSYLDRMFKHLAAWDQNAVQPWTEEGLKMEVTLPPAPPSDPPLMATIPLDRPVTLPPGNTPLRFRRRH